MPQVITMENYLKFKDIPTDKKCTTVALVCSIEERETKTGSSFCQLVLSDGTSQISANLWNMDKETLLKKIPEKKLITVELYAKIYKGALGYEIFRYGPPPEGTKINEFIIHAPIDPVIMFDEILNLVRKGAENSTDIPNLFDMTNSIYNSYRDRLLKWSAAKSVHHNFYGGLLYHTLRMVRSAYVLSKVYPVDTELLFAGAALHDIGKLEELSTDELGAAEYAADGNLFGHTLLGIEIINKEAENNPAYNPEKVRMLKHMLASHHGQLEWGAVTVPAIPEAMLLHQIDMIDSRMMQFEDVANTLAPGEMSDRIFGLNTCVYRPDYGRNDLE